MKTHPRPVLGYILPAQLLVLAFYLWYLTAGLWTALPETFSTDLYDKLATAFQKGQLYLDRLPAPDLLALRDPYAIQERRGVSSYIGDATLYDGKYYLYWGPVPALTLALVKSTVYAGPIDDAYLVFAFVAGLYLILTSILAVAWRQHFAELPRWTLACNVFLVGVAPPLTWMLGNPLIYEAALAAAEFFFMGGALAAYLAMYRSVPGRGLPALAGIAWALAIGCQFTQIIAVAAALAITTAWILRAPRDGRRNRAYLGALAGLWSPTFLMLVALAWYNFARFGSVLEFGYRYQLAVVNLHERYREIFQPIFAIPNLFNYLLNPFLAGDAFPFVFPKYGSTLEGSPISIPGLYYSEAITGLLYSAPIILYALIPPAMALRGLRAMGVRAWAATLGIGPLRWLKWTAIGALLPNTAVLLFFFYSAPRYLMAVMPVLMILATLGFWQSVRRLANRIHLARLNIVVAGLLAAVTFVLSSLLALSSSQDRFLVGNPALIDQINSILLR
jgi:hypothetical protein